MKLFYTLIILLFSFIHVYSQPPDWAWAKGAGGSGYDAGFDIITDASGHIFVVGNFSSQTITFGSNILTKGLSNDVFIVKYNSSGDALWATSIKRHCFDKRVAIATDDMGHIYVAGNYSGYGIIFDTLYINNNWSTQEFFLAKYDTSGNFIWAETFGGAGNESITDITIDLNGDILLTGIFDSPSITFGTNTLNNQGDHDSFIVKYGSSGNLVWSNSVGGPGYDYGTSIITDGGGNVIITGLFANSITFDTITITSAGGSDFFLSKYDSAGNLSWVETAGGYGSEDGSDLAVDINGNIYVIGTYGHTSFNFGSIPMEAIANINIFVVKYSSSGNPIWAKSGGGPAMNFGNKIILSHNKYLYITGGFLNFQMSFVSQILQNAGDGDFMLAKLDTIGNVFWVKSAGGVLDDYCYGIAADQQENIYITGNFESPSISFNSYTLLNSGNTDYYISKLGNLTNIEELNSAGISVYPNPVNDILIINSEKEIVGEIKIYDVFGKLIYQELIKNKNAEIVVEEFDTGIYFIEIDGAVGKFVKE